MSTNPFDDAGGSGGGSSSGVGVGGGRGGGGGGGSSRYARHQHQHPHPSDRYTAMPSSSHSPTSQQYSSQSQSYQSQSAAAPPIFSARGVEWPLPTAFNPSQYRKWRKESKSLGSTLGISGSGLRLLESHNDYYYGTAAAGGGGGGDVSGGGSIAGGGGISAFASSSATPLSSTSASLTGGTSAAGEGIISENSSVVSGGNVTTGGGSTANNTTASGGGGGGGYGGLTGLMGRVLGASSGSGSGGGGGGASLINGIEEDDLAISATRPILPPRAHCVAASNGWIVAVVECSPPPNIASTMQSSSVSADASPSQLMIQQPSQSKHALTCLIPPLRLVSRWNVRRGTSLGSEGNHLVPLPPPVRPNMTTAEDGGSMRNTNINSSNNNDPNFGRIAHTFVDPTGCHVLLSAKNGEAYYLHSTSKKVQKLNGFGPGVDGLYAGFKAGVTLGEAASLGSDGEASVQMGLTPGSYVTAVGWDRDRGTEGSTKRILLGTSYGELYEYALLSPNAAAASSSTTGKGKSSSSSSSPFDTRVGELNMMMDEGDSDPMDAPVLLRRLNAGSGGGHSTRSGGGDHGGAVGGILFQRLAGGGVVSPAKPVPRLGSAGTGGGSVVVLASTGGLHRHTRLHSFRSEPSLSGATLTTLRSAFSSVGKAGHGSGSSFVELPGSVDFAELRSCDNDGSFALATETGIYYGTMERVMMTSVSSSLVGVGEAGGVADAGMLTYDSLQQGSGANSSQGALLTPASIGLTPYHFITLSSTANDVKFINRVARKVVQEERVDWVSVSQTTDTGAGPLLSGVSSSSPSALAAELLADIRRPDQIWLRRGRSLVHISSSCEDRDVWKFTLARCIETVAPRTASFAKLSASAAAAEGFSGGLLTSEEKQIESQFEHAKSLCSNASQKAVVNAVRAEYHLSQGRVELGAKYMAQCPPALAPFADTAARLALPMINRGNIGSRSNPIHNEMAASLRANSHKANQALGSSNMALITFLSNKMKDAKQSKHQQQQYDSSSSSSIVCTMLGTWLTELHLQEREMGDAKNNNIDHVRHTVGAASHQQQQVNHALLHQFLSSFVRDMNPSCIINVLASHDISAGECAGYSAAAGDIGAAVNAALSGEDEKKGALDALRVLNDSAIEKAEPYYYKYALTLLSRAPMSAAKSFVARYTEGLSDNKLLPAFMHYEQRRKSNGAARTVERAAVVSSSTFIDDENASIRYMEGVIKLGSQSRAIYNYLTSLYAGMEDEGPLFRFLSAHVPPAPSLTASSTSIGNRGRVGDLLLQQANEERKSPLDKSYALRTILRTGRHFRSAVKLYMGFGMRQQAVELALKVDPALARELARQSDDKDEMKRLWLMIARNAAANGTSSSPQDGKDIVARVVMVLKDCGPEILSIEDVLPFLPDFAQIDQFKDEICDALASYSSKIEGYLKEMNECDQTCDALRDELGRLKTMATRVRADARCALTNKYIIEEGEPFYAFPSGYVVLEAALKREVIPYLNEKQRGRVKFIENELERLQRSQAGSGRSSYELAKDEYEMEELRAELDGLIAAECPLTGSVMVESIDCGFSDDEGDDCI